ncbi:MULTISPECIES: Sir2 family NAD-dependent protein deacetylase [unclassified Vibrio]|uniref:Sir2 family NAD-dependent protein deacetylase n=1 Tax=unclassified Vibrio TaxID=2614977 RepID=UPI000B9F4FFC|nr:MULTISPECIES: Sir2 family NAD-dependent protein deacetylase [unclassified Vibrio]OXX42230.1 hypothetical protein B9J85_12805 [Vibrio sp. V11_P1A41T118]
MKSNKEKIIVFTGLGVSAESGLATYRDSDGLWNQLPVESLATKQTPRTGFSFL